MLRRTVVQWSLLVLLLFCANAAYGQNPIQTENAKAGTTDWQLTNPAENHEIEGYASLTSVNRGGQISLYVKSNDANYTIDIFRMGWYGLAGGRRVMNTITRARTTQASCPTNATTGMTECNWTSPYVLTVPGSSSDPTNWASGVYLAKLTGTTSGKQSYIIFVVRDDARPSQYLMAIDFTTYQAYNNWGGKSLYDYNSSGTRASKVSYNRPFAPGPQDGAEYGVGAGEFLTNYTPNGESYPAAWEYNAVRWMEKEGYDVSYASVIDLHEKSNLLDNHAAYLSWGHNEYWSLTMFNNVEAARDSGINLGFFGSNVSYWQIRFETSPVTGQANRTQVCYKSTSDPVNGPTETLQFRDLNMPESELIGVYYATDPVDGDIVVQNTSNWVFNGTGLQNGDHLPGLLGYEVDEFDPNASPSGTILLGNSPYGGGEFSNMSLYTAGSGATVFATGSMQWVWALDDYNATGLRPSLLNEAAQTMTRNVLAKFAEGFDSGPSPPPPSTATRINAGGSAYTDSQNQAWSADTGYTGGSTASTAATIANTADQTLYKSERWGAFSYSISVPAGRYDVTLKFAEIYFTSSGQRKFNVAINGTTVLSNFDVFAEAGGANRAIDKTFEVTSTGTINIQFIAGSADQPKVSAIEIKTSAPVDIQVSPTSASLTVNQTQQFTSTVTGSSNTAVTWSTSPAVGTVSSTGLYTAPSTLASQQVVTVTATSIADPTKSASAAVTLVPPDFSISASPGSQSVVQGGGTSYVASISPSNGFNAAVTFSVSGLPAGAAGTFSPASVTGSGTTTLNVTTSGSTPVGTYTVTITGTSGTLVHTTTATLFVGAPGSSFNPVRINAGGPAFTGSQSLIWSADAGFTGGSTGSVPSGTAIANTVDDALYQTERYGAFTYTLTVPAGNYQVTLKFAETYFTSGASSGQRVFNVAINGTTVLTNFDIKAAAGGANIAVDRTFTTTAGATSNNLQIQFIHLATQADLPKVDAIEVIAAVSSPTITTQPASKTVTEGQTAAFTVAASGTAPIGYQWRKGGVNIAGATSSTYTTPATVLADSGATFDVVLSNVAGTVTSTPATLTVSPLAVSALGVNPASVTGAGSSIGTVTLSGPAPAAGTVVQLTSSNPSAATVPGTVTVAANATSATFTVNTLTVAAATSVTISATYQGTTKTTTLTVNPPLSVQSVTLNPSTVTSGATSTGTVTLSGPAPAGGTTVQLASNNTSAATVPGTVTVAASSSTATFTVNTSAVSSVTSVTISATYQGTKTATLTVNPAPSVQSVTLSPGSVTGGATSTGTVTLSAPAPAGGMTVQLASNNTSAATVPGTVTVAASSSTATFTVNTGAVAGLTSVTITATLNGSATATLTVNPAPSFNPIRVNSAGGAFTDSQGFIWSADTGFTGGNTASVSSAIANTVDDALYQTERYGALTYAFTVPAGGYQVTLKFAETYYTSGASSGQRVFNVAINGTTVLNNFDIKAAAGGANIAVDRTFTVMAAAGSNNLQIQLIHLATQPDLPKVNAIEIISSGVTGVTITTQPASQAVTEGQTATFTVAASGSAPISYQWRKGGVNIAGATSPSYTTPATVLADSGATFDVVVSNAAGGVPSNAATLTVNPLTVSAVSVSPASVTGGTSSTGTVTLSGPAPAAGTVVQLTSNNTSAATVPGTVTVQPGATSATFAVNTSAVGSVTSVTISATYQGTTKTTTLAVNPVLSVQSVTLNPGTVTSGATSIGTVTLNGPAPAGRHDGAVDEQQHVGGNGAGNGHGCGECNVSDVHGKHADSGGGNFGHRHGHAERVGKRNVDGEPSAKRAVGGAESQYGDERGDVNRDSDTERTGTGRRHDGAIGEQQHVGGNGAGDGHRSSQLQHGDVYGEHQRGELRDFSHHHGHAEWVGDRDADGESGTEFQSNPGELCGRGLHGLPRASLERGHGFHRRQYGHSCQQHRQYRG